MDVEVPHTDLSEITWMVLVEVDTVMMLSTSVTATSGMLPVFANATMSMGNVTTKLPGLLLIFAHGATEIWYKSIKVNDYK